MKNQIKIHNPKVYQKEKEHSIHIKLLWYNNNTYQNKEQQRLLYNYSKISINFGILALKLKEGIKLNRGNKNKRKVWKDANEVVKTSIVPKKLKWYEREMLVVPKGEKSKWLGFFFILLFKRCLNEYS